MNKNSKSRLKLPKPSLQRRKPLGMRAQKHQSDFRFFFYFLIMQLGTEVSSVIEDLFESKRKISKTPPLNSPHTLSKRMS